MKDRINLSEESNNFRCLRICLGPDGRSRFAFVSNDGIANFDVDLPTLVKLSLGDTVLVTTEAGTLAMFRNRRCIHIQAQKELDEPVEFEMEIDKFAIMLTSLMNARRSMETNGRTSAEKLLQAREKNQMTPQHIHAKACKSYNWQK